MGLKSSVSSLLLVVLGCLVISPCHLLAKDDKESEAKSWLASYADPAQISVDGVWQSDHWGTAILHQTKGAREITGTADASVIEGVVSGNTVYLAFVWHDRKGRVSKVYTASLTLSEDGDLHGRYARGIHPVDKEALSIKLKKTLTVAPTSAEAEPGSASTGPAHVVVYRDHYHNCPHVKAPVFADGKEAANLENGRYLTLNLPPGKHQIGTSKAGYYGTQAVNLDLAPDKTYYVHFDFPSAWVCTINANLVGDAEAMNIIAKTKPNDANQVKMPEIVSLAPIEPGH
jgi:hypothetical protein